MWASLPEGTTPKAVAKPSNEPPNHYEAEEGGSPALAGGCPSFGRVAEESLEWWVLGRWDGCVPDRLFTVGLSGLDVALAEPQKSFIFG